MFYIETCPWCGETPELSEKACEDIINGGRIFFRYDLRCRNCGDTLSSLKSEAHVIDEWNKAVRGYKHFKSLEYKHIKSKLEWHDLRKNPQDLPTSDDNVLAYTKCHRTTTYEVAWYNDEDKSWGTYDDWTFNNPDSVLKILAWKEIEPFEE